MLKGGDSVDSRIIKQQTLSIILMRDMMTLYYRLQLLGRDGETERGEHKNIQQLQFRPDQPAPASQTFANIFNEKLDFLLIYC